VGGEEVLLVVSHDRFPEWFGVDLTA